MCNFKGAYVASTLCISDLQCHAHAISYFRMRCEQTQIDPIFCPWLIKYCGKSGFSLSNSVVQTHFFNVSQALFVYISMVLTIQCSNISMANSGGVESYLISFPSTWSRLSLITSFSRISLDTCSSRYTWFSLWPIWSGKTWQTLQA